MANWERKSAYLLREIVKFSTYADSLKAAYLHKQMLTEQRVTKSNIPDPDDVANAELLVV